MTKTNKHQIRKSKWIKNQYRVRPIQILYLALLLCALYIMPISAGSVEYRDNIQCPFEKPDNYDATDSLVLPSSFNELLVLDTTASLKARLQDGVRIGCGLGLQGYTISYWATSRADPEVTHPWMYVQAALMHDTLVDHVEDSAPVDEGYNVISVRSEDSYTVPAGTYYIIGCHKGEFPSGNTYHTHTQSGTLYVGP